MEQAKKSAFAAEYIRGIRPIIRVWNYSQLASISAFSIDLKIIQLNTVYMGILEQIKSLQLAPEFEFESKFKPQQPSGNNSQSLIKGFDCKLNGQTCGAVLRHGLGG